MKTYFLPYPISTNRYWRTFRNRTIASKEAMEYRRKVAELVGVMPVNDPVSLSIELHPRLTKGGKASKTCLDLDNCLKVTLDALQGCLYGNDNQVKKIALQYGQPVLNGGLTVCCEVMQ